MMKITTRSLRETAYSTFHRNILVISTHVPLVASNQQLVSPAISKQSRPPRRKGLPSFLNRQKLSSPAIFAPLFFHQNAFFFAQLSYNLTSPTSYHYLYSISLSRSPSRCLHARRDESLPKGMRTIIPRKQPGNLLLPQPRGAPGTSPRDRQPRPRGPQLQGRHQRRLGLLPSREPLPPNGQPVPGSLC
jgi:hypothetical protein